MTDVKKEAQAVASSLQERPHNPHAAVLKRLRTSHRFLAILSITKGLRARFLVLAFLRKRTQLIRSALIFFLCTRAYAYNLVFVVRTLDFRFHSCCMSKFKCCTSVRPLNVFVPRGQEWYLVLCFGTQKNTSFPFPCVYTSIAAAFVVACEMRRNPKPKEKGG